MSEENPARIEFSLDWHCQFIKLPVSLRLVRFPSASSFGQAPHLQPSNVMADGCGTPSIRRFRAKQGGACQFETHVWNLPAVIEANIDEPF